MDLKTEIWWIGKTTMTFVAEGCDEYCKRLRNMTDFTAVTIPELKNKSSDIATNKIREADKILEKLQPTDFLILLDEKGKELTSVQFADYIQKRENQSLKRVIFLIGSAYGFDEKLYQRANDKIALSKMTFSHQLIRLVFLEQFYRAQTILHNFPYHNE